ncbi:MAG: DNA polymerase III subunit alpha [Chloroflexota bacterium]|nr:DNA polymerase III subunit alpha [Chloroflexota bacterium]
MGAMGDFVHLHLHSDFSLLDGLGKIDAYMKRATEFGMGAVALTDHGALYGAINFYQAAEKAGIKPIIGCEAYIAPNGMRSKRGREDAENYHLVLLAKNEAGYRNLIKLVSLAHTEGFYYKPRIDRDLLREHADGLVCLSACLAAEVPRLLVADRYEEARETARDYLSIFGEGNYFLELQHHPTIPEQEVVNRGVIELSKELSVPLVCTADVHYVNREDMAIQDVLICVQTGKTLDDPKRLKMTSDSNYFRSPAEMAEIFAHVPEAVSNTARVAELCELQIATGNWILPHFPVPAPKTAEQHLRDMVDEGLRKRLATGTLGVGIDGSPPDFGPLEPGEIPAQYRERVNYEIDIISKKGYPTYFLIVQDFANWSREQGIAITTRGSAAGSLVSYALGITSVDPLVYELPFERFLNPFRPSPPDIDMDFEDNRREEVIEYVARKYGEDKVAQIITFGTMEAKMAVRDVGRVMGMSYGEVDRVSKLIPPMAGLGKALDSVPELRKLQETDAQVARLLDTARRLEGVTRNAGTHAAGVIITEQPVMTYAPVQKDTGGGEKLLIQYDMRNAETIGLMKMDFLGLANLSVLGRAVKILREYRGVDIDPETLPLDDGATYALLATGETTGLFQVESGGMRKYLKDLKPTTILDIAAMIALYRPGPMENIPVYIERKHDPSKVEYLHPTLEPILKHSFGVLVYQDDILFISIQIAGYDWGAADKLRKAVGKKDLAVLKAEEEKFVKGCQSHGGLSKQKAQELWDWMLPFARYGFNRAHAAAYAQITYQTAFLKANYPVEYMTAFLSVAMGDSDKVVKGVLEAKRMGIPILPPSLNRSRRDFSIEPAAGEDGVERDGIRFGLAAVKNVGGAAIDAILTERAKQPEGCFAALDDLCTAVDSRLLNKRVLESLIKAGALDDLGTRGALLEGLERAMNAGQQAQRAREAGQISLFGAMGLGLVEATPAAPARQPGAAAEEVPRKTVLAWEKEMTGLYFSEHPLSLIETGAGVTLLGEITEDLAGQKATVVAMVSAVRRITTKKNTTMGVMVVEDMSGKLELVAFPECFEKHGDLWVEDTIIRAVVKIDLRNDQVQLVCESADAFVQAERAEGGRRPATLHLRLTPSGDYWRDIQRLNDLDQVLKHFEGDDRIVLHVAAPAGTRSFRADRRGVDCCAELEKALVGLLGTRAAFRVEQPEPVAEDVYALSLSAD